MKNQLNQAPYLHVQQTFEAWEIFGFETRNKYRILDHNMNSIGFAAEESTGFLGAIFRIYLGHFRSFNIHIFDESRTLVYKAHFPFRWFFKTLELEDDQGVNLGHIQQRFAIFRKQFDVHDSRGRVIARINSSFFRFWTFEFKSGQRELGKIEKKWSGVLSEMFTDKDNFIVSFEDKTDEKLRPLMLATCLMVDMIYFENKAE